MDLTRTLNLKRNDPYHIVEMDVNCTQMLWTSNGTAADAMNVRTKSSPPVVANGKVYLMTDTAALSIYGLK